MVTMMDTKADTDNLHLLKIWMDEQKKMNKQ